VRAAARAASPPSGGGSSAPATAASSPRPTSPSMRLNSATSMTAALTVSHQPWVDVMITIFCDFRQFSAKKAAKRRFSPKRIMHLIKILQI
jgi:hypothetical protein